MFLSKIKSKSLKKILCFVYYCTVVEIHGNLKQLDITFIINIHVFKSKAVLNHSGTQITEISKQVKK